MDTNLLDLLPDFEAFNYQTAIAPPGSKVTAWNKLRECERRLEMYRWIEKLTDPAKAQHRVMLNDAVSAFLLTFEATLQFLKNQIEAKHQNSTPQFKFWDWVRRQTQYDVMVRGLRALRHFEAHVENIQKPSEIFVAIGGGQPKDTSDVSVSRTWKLPQLHKADLEKLHSSPLREPELSDWNTIAAGSDVAGVFADGLQKLKRILEIAEIMV
jgi:hypothetical protein